MYVGLIFFVLAWGAYLSSPWAFIIVPVFIFYMTRFQIKPEERILKDIFGAEFERYQSKVRRWL
jgi:protein-S-isoprenylcysteine O-methyltransferase Ste14